MQLTMGAIADPQEKTAWDRLEETVIAAIAAITPKELCWRLKIKPGYLSDAIEGRDRKGIRLEWLPVILAMAPDMHRRAILAELAAPCSYEVVRRKELTPEERLAALEERVAQRFGQAGAELVMEARR